MQEHSYIKKNYNFFYLQSQFILSIPQFRYTIIPFYFCSLIAFNMIIKLSELFCLFLYSFSQFVFHNSFPLCHITSISYTFYNQSFILLPFYHTFIETTISSSRKKKEHTTLCMFSFRM